MSQVISLYGKDTCLILIFSDENIPQIVYWGDTLILSAKEQQQVLQQFVIPVPQAFLDQVLTVSLLPLLGNGDFHLNALSGSRNSLAWAPQFKDLSLVIATNDKLEFKLVDKVAQLQVNITIMLNAWDILEQQISLTNLGSTDYQLDELFMSIPLPDNITDMIQFHGRWLHEFQQQRSKINQPCYLVENLKGRTSNDNPPFLITGSNGFTFESGAVYGFHLGWSGNHCYKLTTLADGRKLVQFGEKLLPGEMNLAANQVYNSPILYASFSENGLNGISNNFHRFIRKSFAKHKTNYRPIHLNTWEAMYFSHDLAMLFNLVDSAAKLGIERFVLDDGWFRGRNHDKAGLGDWFVDSNKYPEGLTPLIDRVKQSGMQFGLWFEPEMVNPDSDLFRNNPAWVLQLSGYEQPLGRYQYALNLAHSDAYNYIKNCIIDLLNEYRIDYIKWDMNRDLVQAGDINGFPGVHNQVLATYKLLDEINSLFPQLEIETCSSGGARADLGILRYTNRIWTSDCNDPYERQKIQQGLSIFFPLELMGSHFGPEIAHTTNRKTSLDYRFFTAMFANLGFEQNLLELSNAEQDNLGEYINLYKHYRSLLHNGRFVTLDSLNNQQYGVISEDGASALFAVAQNDLPTNMLASRLIIPYLKSELDYSVRILNSQTNIGYIMKQTIPLSTDTLVVSGRIIQQIGIQLPIMHPQSILLIDFRADKE